MSEILGTQGRLQSFEMSEFATAPTTTPKPEKEESHFEFRGNSRAPLENESKTRLYAAMEKFAAGI